MTEPTWYNEAKKLIGVREIPGAKSNPTIIGWVKTLGTKALGMVYTNDDTPWCGVFVAHCIALRGLKTASPAVRAKAWATWGKAIPRETPKMGAILVFEREGGGHVGFCAGFTKTHFKVLGGNQGNAVSYTWILRSRCIAQRWPGESTQVPQTATYYLSIDGAVSQNEA